MAQKFYVARYVFTEGAPALSRKVQSYVRERFNLPIIRCCVDKYKVAEFEQRMPADYRDEWRAIKHFEHFPPGSTMISIFSLLESRRRGNHDSRLLAVERKRGGASGGS